MFYKSNVHALYVCSFGAVFKHKHFSIQTTPAASFYLLPMIAKCSHKSILQFISSTFTVIFSLITLKS